MLAEENKKLASKLEEENKKISKLEEDYKNLLSIMKKNNLIT